MYGSCNCGNVELHWQSVDCSLVPRNCQCGYCATRKIAWVSKSGTRLRCTVRRGSLYRSVAHGTQTARFHECTYCDTTVLASSEVDGDNYAVINANCMRPPKEFMPGRSVSFSGETLARRQSRRKANWCVFEGLQIMETGKQ